MLKLIPLLILLAGCAASPVPVAPVAHARFPPASAMAECEPLDRAADGTLAEVYRVGVSAGHKYQDCRARHSELVEFIKRGDSARK